jgi:hypothetical protein
VTVSGPLINVRISALMGPTGDVVVATVVVVVGGGDVVDVVDVVVEIVVAVDVPVVKLETKVEMLSLGFVSMEAAVTVAVLLIVLVTELETVKLTVNEHDCEISSCGNVHRNVFTAT